MSAELLPARPNAALARVFAWYLRRRFRATFHRVLLTPAAQRTLAALDTQPGPALALMTHSAWWDPLAGLLLARACTPSRQLFAPMDIAQLRRFAFFRALGLFGIDPDNPASIALMTDYAAGLVARDPRTLIALTPQGTFADPRAPIVLRPGAAALAARLLRDDQTAGPGVVVIALEYVFWTDARPELLVHARQIASDDLPQGSSTAALHRLFTGTFTACAQELAALAIARDETAFIALPSTAPRDTRRGRINPVYDWWLRLRGVSGHIDPAGRREKTA